jgi:hypothetical protein
VNQLCHKISQICKEWKKILETCWVSFGHFLQNVLEIFFKIFHFAAGKKVVTDSLVMHQMLPKNHHGSFDQNG